ncbi:MAG: hypothetical protein RIS29_1308 [Bacteroidota bacterium]|jgi:PST family polysaccharide transporter
MRNKIQTLKELTKNNVKVIENYFFMTVLQVLNSLFYLLIYPYLIRVLGPESYGTYVFGFSVINYFITFISFGFDLPAAKIIAQNNDCSKTKSKVMSCIFTAKVYLEIVSIFIFGVVVWFVPLLHIHMKILIVLFSQTVINIFLPQWYFQGIQKMRIVTIIQLIFKLISIPFIFVLVNQSGDVFVFSLISSLSGVLGSFVATYIIVYKHKLKIELLRISETYSWFKDASPFFGSYALTAIKQQSISVIIGSFFSMRDVAVYDLAYKIFSIPQILVSSINGALFPKIATNATTKAIKQILKLETLLGSLVITFVILFGKPLVAFLGGDKLPDAYLIAVILSFSIMTYLLVSAFINFIFVPQNKFAYVIKNQIVSFSIFFLVLVAGLYIYNGIIVMAIAWSIANLCEIVYCSIIINKKELLGTESR